MQSNNINYKIEKYTHKLKHAQSQDDAELYENKIREYRKVNKGLHGGVDPSAEIKKLTEESKNILLEKLTAKGTSAVYEKNKVNDAINVLSEKIKTTVNNYNQTVTDKDALCANTTYLTNEMKNLQPGCATEEFNIATETLLDDTKLLKSVCGSVPSKPADVVSSEKPQPKKNLPQPPSKTTPTTPPKTESEIKTVTNTETKTESDQKGKGIFF